MNKRAAGKPRQRGLRRRAQPVDGWDSPLSGPARIPGVRIGYIGGRTASVEQIRAYWQARGAVFMHHSLEAGEPQSRLEEILERSDVLFYAPGSTRSKFERSLEVYCERTQKPLILLNGHSLLALADALATSLPLI
jgi:hypothetical protein